MNWRHPESRTPPARLGEMNCYKRGQMNWRHPESRTPPARLGDKWIALRGDKWIGDIGRAGHHQPDWETNELLKGETNELETSGEPDTTSQTGRQMDRYKGKQIKLETSAEPDTTSQTGRQMNCYKGRQMNWRHPESRTPPARLGDKWIAVRETNELETSREPDTTSQTGRQMNCFKRRQMNWRHPESRTPPARLGDKWIAIRGDKWIGDIRRAGHHQPDWETNELL